MTSTLSSQKNAIRMLHVRAKTLLVYLQDVKAGKVPVDHHILREIGSLCNRLPITESDSFKEDLVKASRVHPFPLFLPLPLQLTAPCYFFSLPRK